MAVVRSLTISASTSGQTFGFLGGRVIVFLVVDEKSSWIKKGRAFLRPVRERDALRSSARPYEEVRLPGQSLKRSSRFPEIK